MCAHKDWGCHNNVNGVASSDAGCKLNPGDHQKRPNTKRRSVLPCLRPGIPLLYLGQPLGVFRYRRGTGQAFSVLQCRHLVNAIRKHCKHSKAGKWANNRLITFTDWHFFLAVFSSLMHAALSTRSIISPQCCEFHCIWCAHGICFIAFLLAKRVG